ncbi:helix-turn-helix domain-containing protein [Streptomyces luteolifulvus]|nr:helix-turn-helix transcriptional regulator [Streptomyces luteolifulvus]
MLAQWLESLRRRSGLSWSQMARTAHIGGLMVSQSTLFRAAQGERLPKWKTVQAFVRVCGGDAREARRLWSNADRHEAARGGQVPRSVVLSPQFITEPWQLVQAMNHMRRESGNPTLRELEERAVVRGVSFLPKSTVGAVLRGRLPAKALLLNFVRYCGNVPDEQLQHWADAWERVRSSLSGRDRRVSAGRG